MQDQHWVANHFVPLMPITNSCSAIVVEEFQNIAFCNEEVSLNEYFAVEWEDHSYVCSRS